MSTFHLQIVTPDGLYLDDQVESVTVRTTEGDQTILKNHSPYVAALGIGTMRVKQNGKTRTAAVSGGFLSTTKEVTRVVAVTVEWADEIDLERAKRAEAKARAILEKHQDDNQVRIAQAKLKKALTRMQAAKMR